MVEKFNLVEDEMYWYVYVPPKGINLQVVKMEKLLLEKMDTENPLFKVMREEYGNGFSTIGVELEDEEYEHLFYLDQKDDAEKLWAKEFFKNFNDVYGMEFSEFVVLYKKIQDEYPEWII